MGIRFLCHACDRKLNVKDFLAGKNGICPHCGASVKIPVESQIPSRKELPAATTRTGSANGQAAELGESISIVTSDEGHTAEGVATPPAVPPRPAIPGKSREPDSVDPIEEDPDAVWYVRPPSGGQYGPADGDVMRRWISEKRVSSEGLVWREGWPEWKKGVEVFPQLAGGVPTPPSVTDAPETPQVSIGSNAPADKAKPTTKIYSARARKKKGLGIAAIVFLGLLIAVLAVTLVVIIVTKS